MYSTCTIQFGGKKEKKIKKLKKNHLQGRDQRRPKSSNPNCNTNLALLLMVKYKQYWKIYYRNSCRSDLCFLSSLSFSM